MAQTPQSMASGSQVQVLADMACVEEQAAVSALVIAPDHAVGYGCPDKCDRAQLDHFLVAAQIRDVLQGLCPGLDELQLVLDCKESVDAWLQASDRPDHEIGLKGMAGAPRRYGAQSTRTLCDSLDALRAPQEEGELLQRQCFVAVQADAVTPVDCGPKVNRRDDQGFRVRQVDNGHAVVEWQFQGRLRQALFAGLKVRPTCRTRNACRAETAVQNPWFTSASWYAFSVTGPELFAIRTDIVTWAA